jgi:hypothetical protein
MAGLSLSEIEGNSSFKPGRGFAIIDPLHEDERPWRCNSGQTANVATRIFRRIPRKPGSAAMSARSVRTASRANSAMSARTAAADLSRGRSGLRGNGAPARRLRKTRHPISACISNIVSTMSPRIPRASSISRPRSAELFLHRYYEGRRRRSNPILVIPGWSEGPDLRCAIAHRESLDSGFDPEPVIGPRLARTRWHRPGMTKSFSGNNRPLDLAKTDAVAVALTPAVEAEGIAVFEERPLDIAGQFNRLGAVP